MHELWPLLEDAHRQRDVLNHTFYRRWSSGELLKSELALYAGQYGHITRAIPEALRRAAEDAPSAFEGRLRAHAGEEDYHAELWDRFAEGTGSGTEPASPSPETQAMRDALVEFDSWHEGLLGVYAIESTQGPVSKSKLQGLPLYGINGGTASRYFEIHSHRDEDHAAELRDQLEPDMTGDLSDKLAHAEAIWEANWILLDGVERLAGAGRFDASP